DESIQLEHVIFREAEFAVELHQVGLRERKLDEDCARAAALGKIDARRDEVLADAALAESFVDVEIAQKPLALAIPRRKQRVELQKAGGVRAVERRKYHGLAALQ